MADQWAELDRRDRGTRFIAVQPKSIINRSSATRMPFASANPYIGCEFGCAYCYARDTHRWTVERASGASGDANVAKEAESMSPDEAFEHRILVKQNAAAILARTLNPGRMRGEPLVIGTATDPYQPAERLFRVTRALLEVLSAYRGLKLALITKSPLITRDIDLLAKLSAQHRLTVNLSLAAVDAKLLRRLEPRTPTPAARLRAMRRLAQAGVRVGLLIAPVLPGINDGCESLRALMTAAKENGAAWIAAVPLRMGPAARRTLLPWIIRERPDLAARYRRHYGGRQGVSRAYSDALQHRVQALRAELGMEAREGMQQEGDLAKRRQDLQLGLWK